MESSGVESPKEPARPGPKSLRSCRFISLAISVAEERSSGGGFAKPTFRKVSEVFAEKVFGSAGLRGLDFWMSA